MIWVVLSVLSGLGDAVMFALMKKLRNLDASIVMWVQYVFALPFLFAVLYFYYPEKIALNVYWIATLNGLLLLVTTYLLVKATQISDLSISMPMLSFTPLFLLLMSYVMINESPTKFGLIGIFLIVFGAYVVNIKDYKQGLFEPLKSIFNNKGSFYVILVAFIWSITSILFKIGILGSNPIFFSALVYLFISIIIIPAILVRFKKNISKIKNNFSTLFLLGFTSAFSIILSSIPMLYTIVPYVISLKRSSVIFSVFFGYYIFKEKNIKFALIGTIIMIIGGLLIAIF